MVAREGRSERASKEDGAVTRCSADTIETTSETTRTGVNTRAG